MAEQLQSGMIDNIINRNRLNVPTNLQILDIVKTPARYKCTFRDADRNIPGFIGSQMCQMADMVSKGCVKDGAIIQITEYVCNEVPNSGHILGVYNFKVLSVENSVDANIKNEFDEEINNKTPVNQKKKSRIGDTEGTDTKENDTTCVTPITQKISTQFPKQTPPSSGRKALQPIQALNPYNNHWTIKAKVSNKSAIRNLDRNGQSVNLFTVNLIDDQGSEIEGTLWRELADLWYDKLQDGKVYLFTKGKVKPANRNFTSVRNDYCIDFSNETTIEECELEDASKIQAKLNFVSFDQLHTYIGKKMLVDVLAVVKEVQSVGSVKRKSDGVDLSRRDLLLVDESGKMVRLTTWGMLAEETGNELESMTNPVISVSAVRVTDFDGLSLSTVSRSQISINPKCSTKLHKWWEDSGSTTSFKHIGEGLANSRMSDSRPNERTVLSNVHIDLRDLPNPSSKPNYHLCRVCVMTIDPDQQPFFYTADPVTGKKVVEDGNSWRFASDDTPCSAMERRYFIRVQLMDHTSSCEVVLSNDQAEKLLEVKADDIFQIKEKNVAKFQQLLASKKFSEHNVVIRSSTSEYKGELRQRFQAISGFSNADYVAESWHLIEKINAV